MRPCLHCPSTCCCLPPPLPLCPPSPRCLRGARCMCACAQAMVTGEAAPRWKKPGDVVIGGTINTSNPLLMRATRVRRALPVCGQGGVGCGRARRGRDAAHVQ